MTRLSFLPLRPCLRLSSRLSYSFLGLFRSVLLHGMYRRAYRYMVSLRPGCAALGVVSVSDIAAVAARCGGISVAGWRVLGRGDSILL